jgi:SAM-dependent methyltransferase
MQDILIVQARGRNVPESDLSTVDKDVLRTQYGDDRRLSARQRLWENGPSLLDRVLDLAAIPPTSTVLDVGCGNGRYLELLRQRGHTGPLIGLDYSPGMALVARAFAPTAVGDAQALPVRDGAVDIAICAHMLYHVPDLPRAVGELRRVLRPGGSAVVVTNGPDNTAESTAILDRALRDVAGLRVDLELGGRRFGPDVALRLMETVFERVEVVQAGGPVTVPSPEIVADYLDSIPPEAAGLSDGPLWTAVLVRARELVTEHVDRHGAFVVTSDTAVLNGRCSS